MNLHVPLYHLFGGFRVLGYPFGSGFPDRVADPQNGTTLIAVWLLGYQVKELIVR